MPENHARIPDPGHDGGPDVPAARDAADTDSAAAAVDAARTDSAASAPVSRASQAAGRRSAVPRGESSAPSPLLAWLKEVATVVVIAVVLSFLIKTFLFRAFWIPSESMVNTLDIDDRIFVNLLVPEPFSLSRGDVVVFRDTNSWLPAAPEKTEGPFTWVQDGLTFVGLLPDNSEQHLVKRVIGLPGDHVVCCDAGGKLTINGTAIDESYVNTAEVPQVRNFDVTVPEGKVWVMGDNRNHSADSRSHMEANGGFINLADIEGKAAVIAWPLNRITVLDNYPDVFKNVPAGG
jgi:signal peptidase I